MDVAQDPAGLGESGEQGSATASAVASGKPLPESGGASLFRELVRTQQFPADGSDEEFSGSRFGSAGEEREDG